MFEKVPKASQRSLVPKIGRRLTETAKVEFLVYDGRASRTLIFGDGWTFLVLKFRVADMLVKPASFLTLIYEAPWCKKPGRAMQPCYLENDEDLASLLSKYKRHLAEARAKRKGVASCEITIKDADAEETVRFHFFVLLDLPH